MSEMFSSIHPVLRAGLEEESVDALVSLSGVSRTTARSILTEYPQGYGLDNAEENDLIRLGANRAQARRIVDGFRLTYACDRACQIRAQRHAPVRSPEDVARALRDALGYTVLAGTGEDAFVVVLLDARQRIIDLLGVRVPQGVQADVRPAEVFREAVRRTAHSLILAGVLQRLPRSHEIPAADTDRMEAIASAGRLVGIPVLDYLLVSPDDYLSFAQLGMSQGV